eukprot:SM000202S05905  [mRNA]  locus=s202:87797:92330:- [translate_table: standard]
MSRLGAPPLVILISSDGFRWGYDRKVPTPSIDRLRQEGVEVDDGLLPVFPSVTFPNHYSIATGLFPPWHGIIANHFHNASHTFESFSMRSTDPKWWLGEPIWQTALKQGLKAATFFWPGSEVHKDPWACDPSYCLHYNGSVPYEERVDKVLEWVDLPEVERPSLITLYFEEPDHSGHQFGPDDRAISAAVSRVDDMIGRLLDGLTSRDVLDDVNIILLSDHGMLANCAGKEVYLEDMEPWVNISRAWIETTGSVLALRPPPEVEALDVYKGMSDALASGDVANSDSVSLYLKDALPERFNYTDSDRIQPILAIASEGYAIRYSRHDSMACGGSHGYDNALLSMRAVFFARGPRFASGRKVGAFSNVEIYGLMCSILDLMPAPNNGTPSFADFMLLPK